MKTRISLKKYRKTGLLLRLAPIESLTSFSHR
jgi:hypothetical protein